MVERQGRASDRTHFPAPNSGWKGQISIHRLTPGAPALTGCDAGRCKRWTSAITWEETDLQADLTMGNLVGALALQSDEAALVSELQSGSEEAFAWLIAHYHQPIYSLLARTVRNSADAADLTQEVFIKVFRGIRGFHGESSLRTWIYRIALREASNQRRWWMRHQQQEIPDRAGDDGRRGRQAGSIERHAGRSGGVAVRPRGARGESSARGAGAAARCRSRFGRR